jgi:hypothetical protein
MKVNYGPIETEITLSASGMIAIDQYYMGDASDRAYSSVTLTPENAESIAHEIIRLLSAMRAESPR